MKKIRIEFIVGDPRSFPVEELLFDTKSVWIEVWKDGAIVEWISAGAVKRMAVVIEEPKSDQPKRRSEPPRLAGSAS